MYAVIYLLQSGQNSFQLLLFSVPPLLTSLSLLSHSSLPLLSPRSPSGGPSCPREWYDRNMGRQAACLPPPLPPIAPFSTYLSQQVTCYTTTSRVTLQGREGRGRGVWVRVCEGWRSGTLWGREGKREGCDGQYADTHTLTHTHLIFSCTPSPSYSHTLTHTLTLSHPHSLTPSLG